MIGGTVNGTGCQSLLVGGVADHVHLLFQFTRTSSIADVIGPVESATSAWVNLTHPGRTRFHWQNGYAVFSVGQAQVEDLRGYILNQPEHHRTVSFQAELRAWLKRYEMEWDERYVWD